jgi:hypothetical protein
MDISMREREREREREVLDIFFYVGDELES